jgi:murein peptide amidase A
MLGLFLSVFGVNAYGEISRATITDLCLRVSKKLASVDLSECLNSGLQYTGGRSVRGFPIAVREFNPVGNGRPLGRILLIGGIHGDEYSSVSVVFKWLNQLSNQYDGKFHWRVAPLMNPDGLLQAKSKRVNAHGVDLNRNFPTPNWLLTATNYWFERANQNPRRFPGPNPGSEPESQWLIKEIKEFQPDAIVSVHAPIGIVDFDGPPKAPEKLGELNLYMLGTYPGSLGNYAGVHKRLPVITIELPHAGIMPSGQEIRNIWGDLEDYLVKKLTIPPLQAVNSHTPPS